MVLLGTETLSTTFLIYALSGSLTTRSMGKDRSIATTWRWVECSTFDDLLCSFLELQSVIAYMSDYYSKILPLNSLEDELESADAQFEDEWAKGDFSWSKYNTEEGDNTEMKDSLFCDVCAKKFAKQTVFDAHLIGKKHKTLLSKGQKRIEAHKEVSKIEWR